MESRNRREKKRRVGKIEIQEDYKHECKRQHRSKKHEGSEESEESKGSEGREHFPESRRSEVALDLSPEQQTSKDLLSWFGK